MFPGTISKGLSRRFQCLRLRKSCRYEDENGDQLFTYRNEGTGTRLLLSLEVALSQSRYFLDSGLCQPISWNSIARPSTPDDILCLLGSQEDIDVVYSLFFSGIHQWLPILSPKKIIQRLRDGVSCFDVHFSLLVLSMKVLGTSPNKLPQVIAFSLYLKAKEVAGELETRGLVSLELLQSLTLICVYEIGHGLHPAAFVQVARVARLAMLMGLANRDKKQLFEMPDTWTAREEERRIWWAIMLLDRFLNLGVTGLPLATPKPTNRDLLPCTEDGWDSGQVSINYPLFVDRIEADLPIGLFAHTCQAAHLLGNVIQHRDGDPQFTDRQSILLEAVQLHQALVSLGTYLNDKILVENDFEKNHIFAFALVCSARFTLYDIYGCNEHDSTSRIAEEISMQQTSLIGLYEVVDKMAYVSRQILRFASVADDRSLFQVNPLFCQCIYLAITECAWIYREEKSSDRAAQLREMIEILQALGRVWRTVDGFMELLKQDGILFEIGHT
ncbi:conserved hypothetical protein [Talaromyces stipitatus ATCC 10500]|uniref:Xylanolytic transcriptional activator regulatory domain-containing protein n=1 Tax=Talaromyces stipitatus (strain ATCC 10500 / CBS 375.48 / QM 6759 / NRRL 1006) TaxID=441959 RepID=B8MIQ7_TALSN|nr:uncharacterized protein TSTA_050070 [Talaromyces stipitatus ATCC 10500]EED15569.1 conserved hypothetical protein [Talaromyces stipitatus ATCC 10500]